MCSHLATWLRICAGVATCCRANAFAGSLATMPNILHTLGLTIVAVLKLVFKSVIGLNRHASLSRSAVFLIAFVVVHALGNLSLFGGQGAFNRYGHALTSNPLIKVCGCVA